ncbi:NuoA, NADH-quinone oxidoreductase subunit A [Cereibacter azotoformans]|uniref:NADH-quinone oxidoreductase subunit n=2 Tax=Cereibacter TaxID=1653176 RepID=A0A2T5KDJ8_9RHOB|nr:MULTISPECIES: NADH-quinone oxidoreductase subunit A [Cereibacter]AXQ93695.1 NADH-quinone oxidoreductase subunit A [Cereibacter sphaeroides]MBO4168514.1 NADH-quinone oxidoreductase subunit A [Cereibacter azotoformans]PTR20495.1 NADH dehydrogenase subunit A [Cereibacter azotoformans]UIJ29199.1 NADH-quinone oxidoreductase subunit A [Cereibacter azotoformans]ULB09885.1 NuoA, NADH-quinone oxidoreductase subunit A [Cereibacter azotoformans]
MLELMNSLDPRAALALHLAVVAVTVAAILLVAGALREPSRDGFGTYESGAPSGRPLRGRVATQYFLIAVFFMIFDVEVAVLFAWAVSALELGTSGLIAATIFILVLLAALAWLWMEGALETAPRKDRA